MDIRLFVHQAPLRARGRGLQSHVSSLLIDGAALVKCVSLCPALPRQLAPTLLSPVAASTLKRIIKVFLDFTGGLGYEDVSIPAASLSLRVRREGNAERAVRV